MPDVYDRIPLPMHYEYGTLDSLYLSYVGVEVLSIPHLPAIDVHPHRQGGEGSLQHYTSDARVARSHLDCWARSQGEAP
jgi:hypothetical protein